MQVVRSYVNISIHITNVYHINGKRSSWIEKSIYCFEAMFAVTNTLTWSNYWCHHNKDFCNFADPSLKSHIVLKPYSSKRLLCNM